MSWIPAIDPECPQNSPDLIETLIIPRSRDLGGFEVRRALPSARRQMVGPFIFFDQMGPAEFIHAGGIDVRPHPHIGLGTVTYLLQGSFQHRDSTGAVQMIQPGEVNWMVAGRGVTHSERTTAETRANPHALFGVQTWVALPEAHEETDPSFAHHSQHDLPIIQEAGAQARLILGRAYGHTSPAQVFSDMFYLDVDLAPGAHIPLPDDHEDRGIHILQGAIWIAGQRFEAGQMMVFRPGDAISVKAAEHGARLMLLGGETLNGPRYIWWNFVSSSQERLEAARQAWKEADFENGPFKLPVGDDQEYIPI